MEASDNPSMVFVSKAETLSPTREAESSEAPYFSRRYLRWAGQVASLVGKRCLIRAPKHRHQDPTNHDLPCIGPWNQNVRSSCLRGLWAFLMAHEAFSGPALFCNVQRIAAPTLGKALMLESPGPRLRGAAVWTLVQGFLESCTDSRLDTAPICLQLPNPSFVTEPLYCLCKALRLFGSQSRIYTPCLNGSPAVEGTDWGPQDRKHQEL